MTATKVCSTCSGRKSLDQFGRRAGASDGYRGQCNSCVSARLAVWETNRLRQLESVDTSARKRCKSCGQEKTLEEFHKLVRCKDGRRPICIACVNEQRTPGYEARQAAAPQVAEDRERQRARAGYRKPGYFLRLYGITIEEFHRLYEAQQGCCVICGIHAEESARTLSVDHSHVTGEVRGLLCQKCNGGIGLLQDSPEILRRALAYLEAFDSTS